MLDLTKHQPRMFETGQRIGAPELWRDGIGFKIYLAKIGQRKPLIVRLMMVGAIAASVVGLVYSGFKTPTYSASSELLISNTTLQLSGTDAVVTQLLVENTMVQNAIEMSKSSKVLERVIDRLGLEEVERILPKSSSIRSLGLFQIFGSTPNAPDTPQRQALAALRANLIVNRVGSSQIISVRSTARTAEDAAKLTNEIAGSFVQEQSGMNAVVTTNAGLRDRIKTLGPTARIINEAFPPNRKDGPGTVLLLVLAAVAGAALGLVGGLLLTLFDRRLRSAEQLTMTSTECFGYLPLRDTDLRSESKLGAWLLGKVFLNSPALHYPEARLASILRRVRSAVVERRGSVPHVVGITSCHRGEGKTTLATHWASLIAGDGSRVLLVDASRDDAALSRSLAPKETQGLYQLLRGVAVADDVIREEVRPNLDFLPIGQAAGYIDMHWVNLLDALRARGESAYEWIIVDLPALAPVADVRSAGQILDELLMIVEWGRTTELQLQQALKSLGPIRDKVLGVVINKAPWTSLGLHAARAIRKPWTVGQVLGWFGKG
jgi:Mrp family chromosome partitioning ATPase/capsular polysaccharide biosynthesis protein